MLPVGTVAASAAAEQEPAAAAAGLGPVAALAAQELLVAAWRLGPAELAAAQWPELAEPEQLEAVPVPAVLVEVQLEQLELAA